MTEQHTIQQALQGDKDALETLINGVKDDIYNLSVRMLWHPQDAEDATQEILIKIITKLSTFKQNSQFKTWVWRIAINHLLNTRKRRAEKQSLSFEVLSHDLNTMLVDGAPRTETVVERKLLVEEAKIGCMQAMLLCLKREERATYIVGEIFGLTDTQGAQLFDIQPATYRKRLSRARKRIREFMNNNCGLHNSVNSCRCAKRVATNIQQGRINPDRLLFAQSSVDDMMHEKILQMDEISRAGALYRTHPTYDAPQMLQEILAKIG